MNMKEIAEKVGVSRAAVSQVLNGKDTWIGKETKEKILKIAKESGYQPNFLARSLKTGKTNIIGIASGEMMLWGIDNTFMSRTYGAISEYFKNNKDLKFLSHRISDDSDTDQCMELVSTGMVDGMIFILPADKVRGFVAGHGKILKEKKTPFVLVHSLAENFGVHSIGLDSVEAGYMGTMHLLKQGYTDVALARTETKALMTEQLQQGYDKAIAEKGASSRILNVKPGHSLSGYDMADNLLKENAGLPRAIFATSDAVAYGIIRRLQEEGLKVPEDVAIMGFGDDVDQRFIQTDLSTVSQPALEKGLLAGEMILDQLKDKSLVGKPRFELLHSELIIRKSCGCS